MNDTSTQAPFFPSHLTRCEWALKSPLDMEYHDTEWGVPVHDDRKLFEFLILEGMQAGLSWVTILKKRDAFKNAFDSFNPEIIAGYNSEKITRLMSNPGIIRNRRKIEASILNAQAFLKVCCRHGNFDSFIWRFTENRTIHNSWKSLTEIPPKTLEAEAMSGELISLGFSFAGPTICYAFMQAVGMVNDHIADCFRHSELRETISTLG